MMLPCLIQEIKRCDSCGREVNEINSREGIARDEKRNINEKVIFCKELNCIFDYAGKNKGIEIIKIDHTLESEQNRMSAKGGRLPFKAKEDSLGSSPASVLKKSLGVLQ